MKAKILIIDDEELVLAGWEYALASAGYHVSTASEGKVAVEIAEKEQPDVVITDLFMPIMNGVEICRQIKAVSPGSEIVLISGYPEETPRFYMQFVKAGGRDIFLRKPLFKEELIEAVKNILRERKQAV
ncbi:MAG: response regulator [Nitrospirota bacterium]